MNTGNGEKSGLVDKDEKTTKKMMINDEHIDSSIGSNRTNFVQLFFSLLTRLFYDSKKVNENNKKR